MVTQPALITNALVVGGEGFWVFGAAAQLSRLVKTRNVKGLSAPTQILNSASYIAWCTYFALNHLWFPFAANIMVLLLTIAILGYTLSNKKQFIHGLLAIVVVGPITSYVIIKFPHASGWLGMSYNWIASTPWLLKVVRKKKVSGISEKSLYFDLAAMSLTLAYAIIIHSDPLIAGCIQNYVYYSIIFRYYYRHRHHG